MALPQIEFASATKGGGRGSPTRRMSFGGSRGLASKSLVATHSHMECISDYVIGSFCLDTVENVSLILSMLEL